MNSFSFCIGNSSWPNKERSVSVAVIIFTALTQFGLNLLSLFNKVSAMGWRVMYQEVLHLMTAIFRPPLRRIIAGFELLKAPN